MTYRIRHRRGHYLWFETASHAIRETYTGAVVEVVSVTRDITARVQAEENRRRLAEVVEAQQRRHQDELARSSRLIAMGELASGIAHEINQPLAAIRNYAAASQRHLGTYQTARDLDPGLDPDLNKVARGLDRVGEHAHHASEVIRRLRAFLRKGQRRLEPLDVNAVARQAIRLCAWEAEGHRITIDERFAVDPPSLQADRILLEQVLVNLLRNALDANRERHGDRGSAVTVETALEDDGLVIRVLDQGPGADPDTLERLFTPFYTSKPDGLGLGLPMSRSVIESLGGELNARPGNRGWKCTAGCRWPAARRTDERRRTTRLCGGRRRRDAGIHRLAAGVGGPDGAPVHQWRRLPGGLRPGGSRLRAAGRAHAHHGRPPGSAGHEGAGPGTPIIFVSGHADVPIVVRAFKAGAVDFIEKPYNEQLLLDSVQQALDRERRAQGHGADRRAVDERLARLTPGAGRAAAPGQGLHQPGDRRPVERQRENRGSVPLKGDETHGRRAPAGSGGDGDRRRAGAPAAAAGRDQAPEAGA